MMKSLTLRTCPFLLDFLRENQPLIFAQLAKKAATANGPHKLEQLSTLTGEVDTEVAPEAAKFGENMASFVD